MHGNALLAMLIFVSTGKIAYLEYPEKQSILKQIWEPWVLGTLGVGNQGYWEQYPGSAPMHKYTQAVLRSTNTHRQCSNAQIYPGSAPKHKCEAHGVW